MKNSKGITLLALIVTVIVLIILASISISAITGNNSLINQAIKSKDDTGIAEEKELVEKCVAYAKAKHKYGSLTKTDLEDQLDIYAQDKTDVTQGTNNKINVEFIETQHIYIVNQDGEIKQKSYNPNVLEISELNANASTYFGWDVINYAETLPEELQDTEWQLFYAGALDGETEERIYLISKEFIKNTLLPIVIKNGVEVEGAKPIATGSSEYSAYFGSRTTGVMPQYIGSENIVDANIRKLNSNYFNYLNGSSTNNNIRAVAYMLDTITWRNFSSSNKNYAEWTIGGPTIELLFTAYNKFAGTEYESDASNGTGYRMRIKDTDSYSRTLSHIIENDTNDSNNPFSTSSSTVSSGGYWIASPGDGGALYVMFVSGDGGVGGRGYDDSTYKINFRPIVLLKSNYTLEKTKDSNGNDAFKIVEQ